MHPRVALAADLYNRLVNHLGNSKVEEVAFLAAKVDDTGEILHAFDVRLLAPADFTVQTDFHIRLTDQARVGTIRWAHEFGAALIEAHAHRSKLPAEFSPSDLSGLAAWVPHVRWRLGLRPYVALVFGDDSFDALAWRDGIGTVEPLAALEIGDRLILPTGITHSWLVHPAHRRP
jgi:hypothetical protein